MANWLSRVAAGMVNFTVTGAAENFYVRRPSGDDVLVEISTSALTLAVAGLTLLAPVFVDVMHAQVLIGAALLALLTVVIKDGRPPSVFTRFRSGCECGATPGATRLVGVGWMSTLHTAPIGDTSSASCDLNHAPRLSAFRAAHATGVTRMSAVHTQTTQLPCTPSDRHPLPLSLAFLRRIFIGHGRG